MKCRYCDFETSAISPMSDDAHYEMDDHVVTHHFELTVGAETVHAIMAMHYELNIPIEDLVNMHLAVRATYTKVFRREYPLMGRT